MENHRYDYMLCMPHQRPKKHKHMSMTERAAQFGAFRALTGYEDAISETGRVTDEKYELDEYQKLDIDFKLQKISEKIKDNPKVTVVYFMPDEKKKGGAYFTYVGSVNKIKELERKIEFSDGKIIKIDEIYSLDSDIFDEFKNEGEMYED